jgi:DNA-binding response OmpR family regulator
MAEAPFQRALLVEDELALSEALRAVLEDLGISVTPVTTLAAAWAEVSGAAGGHDFVLLDRNLPDGDGVSLCARLRSSGYGGAVLMLTAEGEVESRVEGLDAGADDYLSKPFSWEELAARIRALARRPRAAARPMLWMTDVERLRIHGPKGWVELTPLEFKLAARLIGSKGAIVGRAELLREVWGFQMLIPRTRTVDHFLGRLRRHFEEDPENPRHFVTVRGAGYRFLQ